MTSVSNTNSREANPGHWSTMQEAGTLLGLRFLWLMHDLLGRRFLSLLLVPVALYFCVFIKAARKASQQYLLLHYQRFPSAWQKPPSFWHSFRHFREFSETVVDKLLAWKVQIDVDNFVIADQAAVDRILADKRGQLIIGSHFGNLEYCRGFMYRYKDKVINVLLYDRHSSNYAEVMRRVNPESRINVYQVDEFDVATVLRFKAKLDAGEWLFIAGDRVPLAGAERTTTVTFLGRETQFPVGPYLLAQAMACPVKLMFSYRNYHSGDHRVHFEVTEFSERIKLPRKTREQQLQQYAQAYARELERNCSQAPLQWFNFFDYWPSQPDAEVSE